MKSVYVSLFIPVFVESKKLLVGMQKRQAKDSTHGALEFPGGKIEVGEDAAQAALRELAEETGIVCDEKDLFEFGHYQFEYPGQMVHMKVYFSVLKQKYLQFEWFSSEELLSMKDLIIAGSHKIIDDFVKYSEKELNNFENRFLYGPDNTIG